MTLVAEPVKLPSFIDIADTALRQNKQKIVASGLRLGADLRHQQRSNLDLGSTRSRPDASRPSHTRDLTDRIRPEAAEQTPGSTGAFSTDIPITRLNPPHSYIAGFHT